MKRCPVCKYRIRGKKTENHIAGEHHQSIARTMKWEEHEEQMVLLKK